MKVLKMVVTAVSATVLLLSAHADIPNGTYTNNFNGEGTLWDLSGSYSGVLANDPTVTFTLTESPSGSFTGSGTFSVNDGTFNVPNGTSSVVGKTSGPSATPKVSTDVLLTGNGSAPGAPNASVAATVRMNFVVNPSSMHLTSGGGTVSIKVTDLDTGKKASRTVKVGENFFPLPSNVNGTWSLTLNLAPNGTKLSGTATILTAPGTSVPLTASGNYSSSSDTSKIKLTGTGVSLNLVIATSGSSIAVQSVKGKAFGQSVDF